jgi:hypothetical protein
MMDIYMLGLGVGVVGLGAMAVSGVAHHGGAHPGHAHGGHGHGGHLHAGHGHAAHVGHGQHGGRGPVAHGSHALSSSVSSVIWSLASPRVLFSVLVGFGAVGLVARPLAGGLLLLALALAGGAAFESFVVAPIWNFLFRFASTPAVMLESSILDEARAASAFDGNGQGLVTIELDGQVIQILGTLRAEDRQAGIRVRGGDRLRVEDVDGARNRCTVSYVGR